MCQLALADINGGGSTLPQSYYLAPGVLTAGFAPYIGSDLGDKEAFLNNDYNRLIPGAPARNVHWVATESKLRGSELDGYSMAHGASWGPLIQVPVAATAVAIRFNKAGIGNLDLSVNDVCGIFSGRLDRWEYLSSGAGTYGPLTVVYPQGPSGTTELFTRFLNAKCSEPAGPFAVTRFFANAYPASVPQTAKSAQGSPQIMEVLNATPGTCDLHRFEPRIQHPCRAGRWQQGSAGRGDSPDTGEHRQRHQPDQPADGEPIDRPVQRPHQVGTGVRRFVRWQ